MSKSEIKPCSCEHEYQDKKYGKGMRVYNLREKTEDWRCTVCENIKGK